MDACLLAQHLAGRIEVLAAETAELGHRVDLLAYATGVDLERLAILDRLRRSWAYPTTWEEMAALGLDPESGSAA